MLREWNDKLIEVSPDDALIDKMDIKVNIGILDFTGLDWIDEDRDIQQHMQGYCRSVARSDSPGPTDTQDSFPRYDPVLRDNGVNSNSRGWIFTAPSGRTYIKKFGVVRGTRSNEGHYPRPLFGGEMNFKPAGAGVWNVELRLQMNFCRLCYHNSLDWIIRRRLNSSNIHVWTFSNEEQRSESGEISLDGKDNWLSRDKISRLRWARVRQIHTGYLEHIERQIRWNLVSADGRTDDSIEREEIFRQHISRYTLDYCEIAWDLAHQNPVQAVRDIYPLLQAYGGEMMLRSEYVVFGDLIATDGVEEYSVSCRLRLPGKNEIAIYAKTNRRIRIEVRYRLHKSSSPLARKTAETKEGILDLVEQLRDYATRQVNEFLSFVRSQNMQPVGHRFAVHEFLDHVYECTTQLTRLEVLRSLVELGRLPKVGRGEFLQVARALSYREVVSCEQGRRTYRVRPEYRHAVELLRSIGIFTPRYCDRNGRLHDLPIGDV